MSVQALKEILEQIDYPVLVEIVDSIWQRNRKTDEIFWNTEDNTEDFENADGETYSIEAMNDGTEYDVYFVINADTGCGETVTYMFNLEKEMKL